MITKFLLVDEVQEPTFTSIEVHTSFLPREGDEIEIGSMTVRVEGVTWDMEVVVNEYQELKGSLVPIVVATKIQDEEILKK